MARRKHDLRRLDEVGDSRNAVKVLRTRRQKCLTFQILVFVCGIARQTAELLAWHREIQGRHPFVPRSDLCRLRLFRHDPALGGSAHSDKSFQYKQEELRIAEVMI